MMINKKTGLFLPPGSSTTRRPKYILCYLYPFYLLFTRNVFIMRLKLIYGSCPAKVYFHLTFTYVFDLLSGGLLTLSQHAHQGQYVYLAYFLLDHERLVFSCVLNSTILVKYGRRYLKLGNYFHFENHPT